MKTRQWFRPLVFTLLILINVVVVVIRYRSGSRSGSTLEATRAQARKDYKQLAAYSVHQAKYEKIRNSSFTLIGDLVDNPRWKTVLLLSEAQKRVILRVNDLCNQMLYLSLLERSTHYQDDLEAYQRYLDQNALRQRQSMRWASEIVSVGLLTHVQDAVMTQRSLAINGRNNLLTNFEVRAEQLGLSELQVKQLKETAANVTAQGQSLVPLAFSKGSNANQVYKNITAENRREGEIAAWAILSPVQQTRWNEITAVQPVPTSSPDRIELTSADRETVHGRLLEVVPSFKPLTESRNRINLSGEQKEMAAGLLDVGEHGLFWLDQNDSGPTAVSTASRRVAYGRALDQFIRVGILTPEQELQLSVLAGDH